MLLPTPTPPPQTRRGEELTCLWGWLLGLHNGRVEFEVIIFNHAIQSLVWRQTEVATDSEPPLTPPLPSPE